MKAISIKTSIFATMLLTAGIIVLSLTSNRTFNLYPLGGEFYLKKIDYFSHYSLVKKDEESTNLIIEKITAIYRQADGWLIAGNKKEMIFIDVNSNIYTSSNKVPSGKKVSPWSIVESTTINNPIRIFRQLLQVSIIFFITNIALLLCRDFSLSTN